MLQWGRVLKDAEIRRSVRVVLNPLGASMGPRLEGRGNPADHDRDRVHETASMGPRLEGRGNSVFAGPVQSGRGASMGPRLEGRGNLLSVVTPTCIVRLQWGRVLKDAEMPWTARMRS